MTRHTHWVTRASLSALVVLIVLVATGVGVLAPPHSATQARAAVSGLTTATVEGQLLDAVSSVQSASLSASRRTAVLDRLGRIGAQLQMAEAIGGQIDRQNAGLNVYLQAQVDAGASIDKISSDLQINLDQLQANIDANANGNITATVGGITVTVKANADQIKADLTASADRLLVDIKANLNVLKLLTLQAQAHVDARRLQASLHANVTQLRLDLNAVLRELKVLAQANVNAALAADASLRVNITAQISGLRAKLLGGINARITTQKATIAVATKRLDGILSTASSQLTAIQNTL